MTTGNIFLKLIIAHCEVLPDRGRTNINYIINLLLLLLFSSSGFIAAIHLSIGHSF
jgi:uncharacterized membrane protein YqaE (UPF0057 family)